MVKGKTGFTHTTKKGGLKGLVDRVSELKKTAVYVGIPQKESSRTTGQGKDEINNAELLYIHTHGIRRRKMINAMDKVTSKGVPYSMAFKMYLHTHGSPLWHSPPRPVLEPAIEANKGVLSGYMKKVIESQARGNRVQTENALRRLGLKSQNICRAWFTDPRNGWAPNSPVTIRRKGSDKPLIDTGELRKAITYVIKER